jgi:hypothetical protein
VPSSGFVRQGGLASVLGGVAYATGIALWSLGGFDHWLERANAGFLSVLMLGVLAALAALARLYASRRENEAYRRLGLLVSLTTFVGVALLFSGTFIEAFVGPPAQQGTPFERDLGRFVPLFAVAGMLGATGRLLVLGALTLASEVLPRWYGAMLFVGSPPFTSSWRR